MKVEMVGERKGQKSLEMIIGLVILLVVAAVVISMFLNIFQEPSVGQSSAELSQIKQQCSQACESWSETGVSGAVQYCTMAFVYDENGDGDTRQVVRKGFQSYCEDGTHCFNVHTCKSGLETLDYEKCREILCRYYQTKQGEDAGGASGRITAVFAPDNEETGVGTCGLQSLTDSADAPLNTWYNQANPPDYTAPNCEPVS